MFERNRIDNTREVAAATATVIVERDDGRQQSGRFHFPRSKTLTEFLNGPACFVEFSPFDSDGSPQMIAKTSIRSLRIVSAPPAGLLDRQPRSNGFDPYEVLGVEPGADRSAVREAFHRHSKTYHPDRYSAAHLPEEVVTYLEAMARRINAAYELLSSELARAERVGVHRTPPVYEKAAG